VQGSTVVYESFTSPVQAAAFFADNELNLGKLAGGSTPLNITAALTVTPTTDINDGYGITLELGATSARPPQMNFLAASNEPPKLFANQQLFTDIRSPQAASSTPPAAFTPPEPAPIPGITASVVALNNLAAVFTPHPQNHPVS
jgi:hypothetical protein